MSKRVFFKNLYQVISSFCVVLVLEIPIFAGFLYSLQLSDNYGWALLIVCAIIICLYFIVGFYWIFQKGIISKDSIKIVFLGKTINEYLWDDVNSIEKSNYLKNPTLKINLQNGSFFYLDDRKKIKYAISEVSNIDIK